MRAPVTSTGVLSQMSLSTTAGNVCPAPCTDMSRLQALSLKGVYDRPNDHGSD